MSVDLTNKSTSYVRELCGWRRPCSTSPETVVCHCSSATRLPRWSRTTRSSPWWSLTTTSQVTDIISEANDGSKRSYLVGRYVPLCVSMLRPASRASPMHDPRRGTSVYGVAHHRHAAWWYVWSTVLRDLCSRTGFCQPACSLQCGRSPLEREACIRTEGMDRGREEERLCATMFTLLGLQSLFIWLLVPTLWRVPIKASLNTNASNNSVSNILVPGTQNLINYNHTALHNELF